MYVQLLGEGTAVYRPAPATILGEGVALLQASEDYDPEDEDWEFKPGAIVRLEWRRLSGGNVRVAVAPTD